MGTAPIGNDPIETNFRRAIVLWSVQLGFTAPVFSVQNERQTNIRTF